MTTRSYAELLQRRVFRRPLMAMEQFHLSHTSYLLADSPLEDGDSRRDNASTFQDDGVSLSPGKGVQRPLITANETSL